ncbi:putative F-box/LRR-repeat protein 23 [Triticum aestivum]|nr:putative F-box/LRR-repeat protein 23 [Triticum aestivum]
MPSSPPSPPPAAAPRSRRSKKKTRTYHVSVFWFTPVPLPERDWAELHPDLISCIFHKLDQAELLLGGVAGVCRSWRRAAREEPELWRCIDLRGGLWFVPPFHPKFSLEAMVRAALRLSQGQCEAFLTNLADDDILLLLAKQAPALKCLHLHRCYVSDEGFAAVIKMLPLLEELEISKCPQIYSREVYELVATACPLLKHFRHVSGKNCHAGYAITFAAPRMRKLRSLDVVGCTFGREVLLSILDNCHDLEYLNMSVCDPIAIDNPPENLAWMSMNDLYWYWSNYYNDYTGCNCCHPYKPRCNYCRTWSYLHYQDDPYYDYCYYLGDGDDVDDANLEEYENILDIKSMRRYLS